MQEISNEMLRMGAGVYLLWYLCCVCVIFADVMKSKEGGLKSNHIVSIPFYGFLVSFMVPILIALVISVVTFIAKLFMFVITGEF